MLIFATLERKTAKLEGQVPESVPRLGELKPH